MSLKIFSSIYLILLTPTFGSVIHFKFFVCDVTVWGNLFIFFRAMKLFQHHLGKWPSPFHWNTMVHWSKIKWLHIFLDYLFYFIDLCVHLYINTILLIMCGFILSLGIKLCIFNSVISFQIVWAILDSFYFPVKLIIRLSISTNKNSGGIFLWQLYWNYRSILGKLIA